VDVGEVHFETVLVLVGARGHLAEVAGCVQGLDGGEVEAEWAEGGGVGGVLGEGEVGEVGVVGGAEEEDAFAADGMLALGFRVGGCADEAEKERERGRE